jgi:hypothetical protein
VHELYDLLTHDAMKCMYDTRARQELLKRLGVTATVNNRDLVEKFNTFAKSLNKARNISYLRHGRLDARGVKVTLLHMDIPSIGRLTKGEVSVDKRSMGLFIYGCVHRS